jgi:ribosomal protein S18 acetylase RimI-like enzyme
VQATHTTPLEHDIYPLTFLQVYQSANAFIEALAEQDITVQAWFGQSAALKRFMIASGIPLYYHMLTSGYGILAGPQIAGWMYLRGWRQVLYVDGLAVLPQYRRQGVGKMLLNFAEVQARELRREWLGLTVTVANAPAVALYDQMGFQRGHDRILCTTHSPSLPTDGASLRPLLAPSAPAAYYSYAERDLLDGDPDTATVQSRFLGHDPYHNALGKYWLATINGKPLAYLNRHNRSGHTILYVAAYREAWNSPELIAAIGKALQGAHPRVELRVPSPGHHEVMGAALAPFGFTDAPAITMKMFKHLI